MLFDVWICCESLNNNQSGTDIQVLEHQKHSNCKELLLLFSQETMRTRSPFSICTSFIPFFFINAWDDMLKFYQWRLKQLWGFVKNFVILKYNKHISHWLKEKNQILLYVFQIFWEPGNKFHLICDAVCMNLCVFFK